MEETSLSLAPIALFAFNRPKHTAITIEALLKNTSVRESNLFIYCDAPKSEEDIKKTSEVAQMLDKVTGFKSINIIRRQYNYGLADNIVSGVTEVLSEYKRVIVLEDDMRVSSNFLDFMNKALDYYYNEKQVMHINGWNYPLNSKKLPNCFLWRVMNCWGWGTWEDRWRHYIGDTETILKSFNKMDILRFNLYGVNNYWSQIIRNHTGAINTWAIFWYASIFLNNGLCLSPTETLVENIGLDGSGMHCGRSNKIHLAVDNKIDYNYPSDIKENRLAVYEIAKHLLYNKINIRFRSMLNASLGRRQ